MRFSHRSVTPRTLHCVLIAALCGPPAASAAEGLRIATSISPNDPVFAALRALGTASKEITQAEPSIVSMVEAPAVERSQHALKLLHEEKADVAVIDMAEISPKPILAYSLQPFLAKDIDAARRLDLGMRKEIKRILLGDLGLSLLGTLPRLPRVVLIKQPSWNGAMFGADVLAPSEAEAAGFARLRFVHAKAASPDAIGPGVASGSARFGIVPLSIAGAEARANGLWIYDMRASYPVLAVLAVKGGPGRLAPEQRTALAELVLGFESLAWERIDRVAEGVIERARAEKAPFGELTKEVGDSFAELVAMSLAANARQSVSEVVAHNSQRQQRELKASGDEQVYGRRCRNLEILLVTNRALAGGTHLGPDGELPKRGAELLASLAPATRFGIVDVQIQARHTDPAASLGECRGADGRVATVKGVTVQRVRLVDRARFISIAAGAGTGFPGGAPFLVFVHGYRVDFRAGVETAARLSWRMRHSARPVLLSWPSAGRLLAYGDDGKMAAASPGALQFALETLARLPGRRPIDLVAHSMGNRVTLDALEGLRKAGRKVALDELATVAPDVQCAKYASIMQGLRGIARRATLYLYEDDYALKASKAYWSLHDRNEVCRMGSQRGPAAAPIAGLEPVDWSCINEAVDTHSYYVANDYIAGDLRETVLAHRAPVDRDLEPITVPPSSRYYLHLSSIDKDCAGVR